MNEDFEIQVEKIDEAGYYSAMAGLSFNKDKIANDMPKVAEKLCNCDYGHNKFMEQIITWWVIRAPRYWWQEADTYRLSSKSSQSTMHTILNNELTVDNFECNDIFSHELLKLNAVIKNKDLIYLKRHLPEGFMQKRMWMLSYKTLRNIIQQRKTHKLPHWKYFIDNIINQVDHPEYLQ